MKKYFTTCLFILLPLFLSAQIITTQPEVVTETGKVDVIFNAAEGNKGLQGFSGEVYAHTGVITSKSVNDTDWKYAPRWGDNSSKYKLIPLGNDTWKLEISPDIRTYYGLPPDEVVIKLAFVFRSADNTREGKGTADTDIFVPLNETPFTPSEPVAKQRPHGITDGINYIDNSTLTLLLYAPGKKHVHLIGDFNEWRKENAYQLYKDGDYWWYTLSGLEKGKEYAFQYLIDNSFKIADAYAEKVLDPRYDNDIPPAVYPSLMPYPLRTEGIVSVLATGRQAYDWKSKQYTSPPKEELLIYELLIRDFTQEASIQAAGDRLDYLQALGVNAIELMPIQEFDGNDSWGYNPCFFFAPDKAYGTPEAYKAFIDEVHRRGMAVILDVVFNHATGQHPFARLYWQGQAPAADNPWFNPSAPHPYSVFNDFNHEFAGTRDFFKRVLTHWINEYNVDGFRFDLSKGFTQKQSSEATAANYDASRIDILKDYNNHIQRTKPGAYLILEHFCEPKEELELAEAGMMLWNNLNEAYSESIMGWKNSRNSLSPGSASGRGWSIPALVTYAESHDEERMAYKAKAWGNWNLPTDQALRIKRAALAAAFLLCTPGPKMLWQFGELAYDVSIDQNGRTGRKPVLWHYADEPQRKALYDTCAGLLRLRAAKQQLFASPSHIEMQTGSADWEKGRAIRLSSAGSHLVLLGNFVETPLEMPAGFSAAGLWTDYFTGEALTITAADANRPILLPPHSFKLFTTETMSANEALPTPTPPGIRCDPATRQVRIHSSWPVEQVRVYTLSGALRGTFRATSTFSAAAFPPGAYIVQIRTGGKTYYNKLALRPH
jgi:1,4-alpha-glucan branching enzyme